MVFAAPNQSLDFRQLYTERIDVLDTEELSSQEGGCLIKTGGVYFNAEVVDLAGNGTQQILVESNSIGTCSSCLSEVSVYGIEKDRIINLLAEYYNDIKYGKGQGLWVQSFKTTDGHIVPVEKSFFGARRPQRKKR